MINRDYLTKYFMYSPESGEFHRLFICDRWGNETPVVKKVGTLRSDGYLEINIKGCVYKNHRLAFLYMVGQWPNHVDHVNGDRCDNRWVNLRNVDRCENMKNKRIGSNNTSGTLGVTWFPQTGQWRVRINVNGERISLGLFDTLDEAVAARKGAEKAFGYHLNHGRTANEN